MNYKIIRGTRADLDRAEKGDLSFALWGTTYTPECHFYGVYNEDGFVFRLTCREKDPRITYLTPGGEVCEDSCLEFFCNFAPHKTNAFINFEMNAGGAWLFGIGPDRYQRTDLSHTAGFTVEAERSEECWQVTLTVPKTELEKLYGPLELEKGVILTGNVYKCGDLTEEPHYLSWSNMNPKVLDFHRPDRFGTFELA